MLPPTTTMSAPHYAAVVVVSLTIERSHSDKSEPMRGRKVFPRSTHATVCIKPQCDGFYCIVAKPGISRLGISSVYKYFTIDAQGVRTRLFGISKAVTQLIEVEQLRWIDMFCTCQSIHFSYGGYSFKGRLIVIDTLHSSRTWVLSTPSLI